MLFLTNVQKAQQKYTHKTKQADTNNKSILLLAETQNNGRLLPQYSTTPVIPRLFPDVAINFNKLLSLSLRLHQCKAKMQRKLSFITFLLFAKLKYFLKKYNNHAAR